MIMPSSSSTTPLRPSPFIRAAKPPGEFAGRKFHFRVPGEIGLALVRLLYEQGFDPAFSSTAKIDYAMGIPLTHLKHSDLVLPVYVNAYLPPQPPVARCYAFGQAIARSVAMLGLRAVVLASGGMSHFPGTDRYAHPELAWDKGVLGNELLPAIASCWPEFPNPSSTTRAISNCAAGPAPREHWANANPTSCSSILHGTTTTHRSASFRRRLPKLLPIIRPSSLNSSNSPARCTRLRMTNRRRPQYVADPRAWTAKFQLTEAQRHALIELDVPAMVAMGAHPLIPLPRQHADLTNTHKITVIPEPCEACKASRVSGTHVNSASGGAVGPALRTCGAWPG